jgi:single-strand DNA-binding protein
MSEGMNKVYLLGNVGADPELRQTSGGELLRLRLATNERWLDKNQERQERVEWHTIILWGKRAAALSRILTKGSRVMVEGNLRTSSYEKDGATRYSTEIRASNIYLAGRARDPASGDRPYDQPPPRLEGPKTGELAPAATA